MSSLWVHPDSHPLLEALGIRHVHDAWKKDLPGKVVNDRGDRQVLQLFAEGFPHPVYLKRWRFPEGSPFRVLPGKGDLRYRARREKANLDRLREGGIVVPRPLALGEIEGPLRAGPTATFLLLEELTGYRCCADLIPMEADRAARTIRGITSTLARLHEMGLYTRSPGLKHFYTDETFSSFGMIDVPRLDSERNRPWDRIRKGLGHDVPCRERDLSKVWVEWESHHPNRGEWIEAFWDGYASVRGTVGDDPEWRERVEEMARRRHQARLRRSKS